MLFNTCVFQCAFLTHAFGYYFSLRNHEFERYAGGFMKHVKKEHNMWAYLFFMLHLRTKTRTSYTAVEQYIADQIREKQLTWVPSNQSISLQAGRQQSVSADMLS